jgi:DNA-binding LytR/AlgR family response regulator
MKLHLSNRDELFVIHLDKVLFFEADDHYTLVQYVSGGKFMVPFNLSNILDRLGDSPQFVRVGRSHIVNLSFIHHLNATKQMLMLGEDPDHAVKLHLSRPMLRTLMAKVSGVEESPNDCPTEAADE